MKKLIALTTFIFLIALSNSFAQGERGLGLSFDDAAYLDVPYHLPVTGRKFNNIKPAVSLRMYCPIPTDQGKAASCVGHATRSGFTIEKSIKNNITDRQAITEQMHSPGYIYNQIKVPCDDCGCGSRLTDALWLMTQQGVCLSTSFEDGNENCTVVPGEEQHSEAGFFKIKDFAAIFKSDDEAQVKIDQTLTALSDNKPVLIGMNVTTSFWSVNAGQKHWELWEENDNVLGGHAMVVIGYDLIEKKIELMNSYGPYWGDGGFITMDLEDYGKLVKYGFTMLLDDDMVLDPPVAVVPDEKDPKTDEPETEEPGTDVPVDVTKKINLQGDFAFRFPTGYVTNDKGEKEINFQDAEAAFDKEINAYSLVRKDWKVNDVFQLVSKNMQAGEYVYVYSIDATGKMTKHWPSSQGLDAFENVNIADWIPSEDTEIIIPGEGNALQVSSKGDDNLIVLYSEYSIKDIDERMEQVKSEGGNYCNNVQNTFSDLLVPAESVQYSLDKMQFTAQDIPEDKGTLVPLILTVTAN